MRDGVVRRLWRRLFGSVQEPLPVSREMIRRFPETDALIVIGQGSLSEVRTAIEEHAGLVGKVEPVRVAVRIRRDRVGETYVGFPEGVPPYDLVNLLGWLDAPPDMRGVGGARAWMRSPKSKVLYSLVPELDNEMGDTLVGGGEDGTSVRVYMPEVSMCRISGAVPFDPPPQVEPTDGADELTFDVIVDGDRSFGNPDFEFTHPHDTVFHP